MKLTACLLLASLASLTASADEKPLLAIPGEVIYQNKLDSAPAAPWKAAKGQWELKDGCGDCPPSCRGTSWKAAKGQWELKDGVWRGSELEADKHGAVTRLPNKLSDFIIEYEFKFEGARTTSLSINAIKDHMARINITPKSVTVQRDDNDHGGPDKAVVFARFPADLAPGTWHKVRLEMVGNTLLGQVGSLTAWGSDALFTTEKASPGFTVAGQSVDFRNLTIRKASLNPAWEEVKATLPKPGEKVMPAAPKGQGKGKGKGKSKAGAKKRQVE